MRRDNPLDSQIPDILRRLRELETQSPLSSSSITRGQLRVASNEGLWVEGSLKVSGWSVITGTEKIDGRLWGLGVFDWEGEMNLSGAQNITGPATFKGAVRIEGQIDVIGPWKLLGNGEIVGNTAVKGNVEVSNPGQIRVTGGASPATLRDGALTFDTGGQVVADTGVGGVKLQAGDAVVNVGSVASMRKGSTSIIVGADGVTINPAGDGPIDFLGKVYFDRSTIPTVSVAGLPPDVLLIGGDGSLKRTV